MCTSEPVSLESSAAACVAWRASSEPSVASSIFVGNMLISLGLLGGFPYLLLIGTNLKLLGLLSSLGEQPEQIGDRDQDTEDHHGQQGGYPEPLEHPGCVLLYGWFSPCPLQLSRQGGVDVPVDQVRGEHREGCERQGDHDEAGALDLDGFRQDAAVEPDEHPRVEEHHDPAARGSYDQQPQRLDARPDDHGPPEAHDPRDRDVEFALAPEFTTGQVTSLERVGGEPGDVVHDAYVGREQDREACYVEKVLEPGPYSFAENLRLFLQEGDIPWVSVTPTFRQDRGDKHGEANERQQPYDDEGQELLPVGDLPPAVPAAHVLLVYLERVSRGRPGFLFAGDRGDDAGDMDPHAHPLVAYVVALAEVVGAAGTGEGYRPQDRRDPDLVYVAGQVGDACGSLGDDPRPGREISGYDNRHHQKGNYDDDKHHLDPLDRVVDNRGDGYGEADGEEQYRDDPGNRAITPAGEVGQRCGGARSPARECVRQNSAEHEHYPPGLPEAAEACHGGLACRQGVAFDLHVEEVLRQETKGR